MLNYITTVKENNKGGRIWIEGESLRRAGFKPNSRYRLEYRDGEIILSVSKKGERTVSKRTRSNIVFPIIDINNQKILEIFQSDTPVVASLEKRTIRISIHEIKKLQKHRENVFFSKLENDIALDESSLFTGGGISTHAINKGLKKYKIKSKISSIAEMDPSYLQIAQRNLNPAHCHVAKIEDIQSKDIKGTDILSFSMPCTGHSNHGKASNKIKIAEEHSQANTALFGVVNYIVNSNPAILISENVVQAKYSATYILLKAEINRLGYDIFEYDLDQNQAGSIEKRKRYWFVAISKGISKVVNLEKLNIPTYKREHKNIKSILDERDNEKWMKSDYFNSRLEKNISNNRGFRTSFVNEDQDSVNVIPRNYTKRQISNPHFINKEGDKIRLFNPKEHCLIKGVPFKLLRGVSDTKAHEILGQSVAYKQAMGIGEIIGELCSLIKN